MNNGDIFSSNMCGDFKIIDCSKLTKVLIRFIDTGTEMITRKEKVINGQIRDKDYPLLCGVGFIGYGVYATKHRSYQCWSSMIRRCYEDAWHDKKPAYKTCEASEEWQEFQVFAAWYDENYPEDGISYELDKDHLVKGNKLYSSETCVFLSKSENSRIAGERFSSMFEVVSPLGVKHKGFNQTLFAKEHGILQTGLSSIILGKQLAHKGWTLA